MTARWTAQSIVHEYRSIALHALEASPQAEAEARSAHAAQMRRRHLHPSLEAAEQAAEEAAEEARRRAAEHLLTQRSNAWLAAHSPASAPPFDDQPTPYELGAAKVHAARATTRPEHTTGISPASTLVRPEPDDLQAAAEAEETARLRAQIAAEAPGLAAWTAAHHGVTYDMPACSRAEAGA
ncbi:hypothetical protein [Streptomyces sp. N2A]|uniref:hypothetical protein n=1 Tax=Streptomyces sp. N2A TaxID=3073936 RepID=UPI00287060F5|nr:hypothetical protein [Streptomyces sp. N2A]